MKDDMKSYLFFEIGIDGANWVRICGSKVIHIYHKDIYHNFVDMYRYVYCGEKIIKNCNFIYNEIITSNLCGECLERFVLCKSGVLSHDKLEQVLNINM